MNDKNHVQYPKSEPSRPRGILQNSIQPVQPHHVPFKTLTRKRKDALLPSDINAPLISTSRQLSSSSRVIPTSRTLPPPLAARRHHQLGLVTLTYRKTRDRFPNWEKFLCQEAVAVG